MNTELALGMCERWLHRAPHLEGSLLVQNKNILKIGYHEFYVNYKKWGVFQILILYIDILLVLGLFLGYFIFIFLLGLLG